MKIARHGVAKVASEDAVRGIETLQRHGISFTVLCMVSASNAHRPAEIYRFFRSIGIEHLQFIPQIEFDAAGIPLSCSVSPLQYGEFMKGIFRAWMEDRAHKRVFIRNFETILEALNGQQPSICTMHEGCYSYVVVEYDGDVYPCDFYVEQAQFLGNINSCSFEEIAASQRRLRFAAMKKVLPEKCQMWSINSCVAAAVRICAGSSSATKDISIRSVRDTWRFSGKSSGRSSKSWKAG